MLITERLIMTAFKMPEPTLHESGPTDYFGRLLCYTEEDMKNALRDVLEQAAQLAEGALHFSEPIAKDIRSMKEQIK